MPGRKPSNQNRRARDIRDDSDLRGLAVDPLDLKEDYQVIVILEWDGKQPNGTFYDKMHKLGVWVRGGDKQEQSPLIRRASMGRGDVYAIAIQEGAYLCKNIDIAKEISELAVRHGAKIKIAGYLMQANFAMTASDFQVFGDFTKRMGKRGRPRGDEKGIYTVTCFFEGITYEAELESAPVQCSECGSYRIQFEIGRKPVFYYDREDLKDLWAFWLCTRFNDDGRFRVPALVKPGEKNAVMPRRTPSVNFPKPNFTNCDDFFAKIGKVSDLEMLSVYDAAFCLGKVTETDRLGQRYALVGQFGGEKYLLFANETAFDPIDICIVHRDFCKFL